MSHLKYRPEIDGLRAIAVISVVLFHARLPLFSGGYTGVDIFFVISGFLITSIIHRELTNKSFSLVRFYERRIRRIIPALAAVIITTIVGFSFIMTPDDYMGVNGSVVAASAFVSNMFFMRQDGYFDSPEDTKPLLHTWSLAVEEQFYILLPLLLMLCFVVFPKHSNQTLTRIIIAIILCSLGLSIALTLFDQDLPIPFITRTVAGNMTINSTNFYSFPTRAWELAIGSLIALHGSKIKLSHNSNEGASYLGALLILSGVFFLDDDIPFPGYSALLPTIGTALIIVTNNNQTTTIGKMLSARINIWFGKISYSLYLWHWPIFVFAWYLTFNESSPILMLTLSVLSVVVSYFSYKYIETPFRDNTIISQTKYVFIMGGCVTVALIMVGLLNYSKGLNANSLLVETQLLIQMEEPSNPRREECFERSYKDLKKLGPCLMGNQDIDKLQLLLIGDSHADAIMPTIEKLSESHNIKSASITYGKCLPLFGVYHTEPSVKQKQCTKIRQYIKQYVQTNKPENIILVGRWTSNILGNQGNPKRKHNLLRSSTTHSKTESDAYKVFSEQLLSTIDVLSAHADNIWIMKQVPEQKYSPETLIRMEMIGRETTAAIQGTRRDYHVITHKKTTAIFDQITKNNVHILDPADILCDDHRCKIIEDNHFIYRDDDHLNPKGALLLTPIFEQILTQD
jgi:peptidoglycan/LPS O-acetylase OafA/YrhL